MRIGASAGMVEVSLTVDTKGHVSVSAGVKKEPAFKLGDADGSVLRDTYEIGRKFQLVFDNHEHVRQISGENDSIIMAG